VSPVPPGAGGDDIGRLLAVRLGCQPGLGGRRNAAPACGREPSGLLGHERRAQVPGHRTEWRLLVDYSFRWERKVMLG
jgi:hypothetical protein